MNGNLKTKFILTSHNGITEKIKEIVAFLITEQYVESESDYLIYENEYNNEQKIENFCKGSYVAFITPDASLKYQLEKFFKYCFAYATLCNQDIKKYDDMATFKQQFNDNFKYNNAFTYAEWVKLNKEGMPSGQVKQGLLQALIKKCIEYIFVTDGRGNNGIFYLYENGVYKQASDNKMKSIVNSFVPDEILSDSALNGVVNLLKADGDKFVDFMEMNADERYINFKNGLYDIKENTLKPHTSKIYTTRQIQANYDPSAKCEKFDKYLSVFCSDNEGNIDTQKIFVLMQYLGLTISNINVGRKTKKCLCLMSRIGDTGKSVFLNVLSALLGTQNTINISMQNLCDRFSGGDLYGKRAIISGDQSAEPIRDSSIFKQITGGDVLKAELKGQQSFNMVFDGAFIFACNDLPTFKDDKGKHIFDRFIIIKAEHYLKPDERDRTLTDQLLKELDGIAYLSLQALQDLIKNGYNFSVCESSEREIMEYRKGNDPMAEFLEECCEVTYNTKSDRIRRVLFENTYIEWRNKKGYTEVKKKNIKDRADKSGIVCGNYNGNDHYKGVKFKMYTVEEVKDFRTLPKEFWETVDTE